MQNVLETGKRALSVAVAAATIMFSVGASLLTPSTAEAASAGDLIKGSSLSTVYYYGHDGSRYTFPNAKTYETWFPDFSGVQTISDSALAAIPLAGNVVYRPGSYWVKIQSDAKVYAVGTDGMLHWIESEDVAVDFAGSDWNQRIHDVPDVFFTDYSVGTSLMDADAFDGALFMDGGKYYISWGGEMREISSAGRSANNLRSEFFLDGSGIDASGLSSGSMITSEVASLVDPAQTVSSDDDGVTSGDLEISLASSNPAAASVPKGAVGVELMSFDVEAGNEDATLNSVALTLSGLSSTSAVGNVYLYEGVTRLTESRTVNSSTRMLTFGSLNFDVDAGDTRTITVRADVGSSAATSDIVAFSIASADDIDASGDVDGRFPVSGNNMTIASVTVGEIDIDKSGTIENPSIGENDAVIGEFKINATSEDASIEAITLKVDDASDHDDFKLWVDDEVVAEGMSIGDDLVAFDMTSSPVEIEEGRNETFNVSADIGGENADTVKVYVDKEVDVIAIGGDYGFGMTVNTQPADSPAGSYDGTSCTSASGNCSFSTIEGGDVTFVFEGPAARDIEVDSQDVTLLEFSLSAAQEMTVKDLDVYVYGDDNGNNDATDGTDDGTDTDDDGLIVGSGTNVAALTDIKIVNVDTGSVIMGPLELDGVTDDDHDGVQTIDFTDDFGMEAGETLNLAVVADIDDGVTSGTEFAAGILMTGFSAEDVNGDAISSSSIVPTGNIVGYNHEAVSASVTFALASAPTSSTIVQGRSAAELLGLTVTTGDASDVLVRSMTFTAYGDDTNATAMSLGGNTGFQVEDYISSCTLYNGDDAISSPKAPTTGGDIVFSSLNWSIDAGATELLSVVCNIANTSDTDADAIALDLQTGDITVENADGDSITPTLTVVDGDAVGINDASGDADATDFDATVAMTIEASGTITAAASSGTPSADFLMTGSSSNYVGEFTFTATYEDFLIDKLVVEEVAAGEFGQSATAYSNNISLVTIAYPDSTGATATKTAAMSSAKATFSGLDFLVDVNDESNVKVYVNVPSSDRNSGGSATSNERVEVALSSTSGDFNAVGADSGTTDTQVAGSDVDTDKVFVVRETKPTISLSSSSPSGSKTPGNQEVYRFNIAAHSNEDVVFSELVWKMSASDNSSTPILWNECDTSSPDTDVTTVGDFAFYNLSEEGTTTDLDGGAYSFLKSSGAICDGDTADIGFVHLTLPTAEIVPAGQTYTYSLWYNASRVSAANDDTLQFELQGDLLSNATMQSAGGNATATAVATALTMSANVDGNVTPGDVLKVGSEYMLLVEEDADNDNLNVIRGYLGTTPASHTTAAVTRLPSGFYWQDDGAIGTGSGTGYGLLLENWGAYLVDNLSVAGGTIAF